MPKAKNDQGVCYTACTASRSDPTKKLVRPNKAAARSVARLRPRRSDRWRSQWAYATKVDLKKRKRLIPHIVMATASLVCEEEIWTQREERVSPSPDRKRGLAHDVTIELVASSLSGTDCQENDDTTSRPASMTGQQTICSALGFKSPGRGVKHALCIRALAICWKTTRGPLEAP